MSKQLPGPPEDSPTPPADSVEGELVPELSVSNLDFPASEPPPTDAEFEPIEEDRDSLTGDSQATESEPTVAESVAVEPEVPPLEPEVVHAKAQAEPQAVQTEPQAENVTPEELVAARWYTTGFLVVVGVLSVAAVIGMILLAIRMYDAVVNQ